MVEVRTNILTLADKKADRLAYLKLCDYLHDERSGSVPRRLLEALPDVGARHAAEVLSLLIEDKVVGLDDQGRALYNFSVTRPRGWKPQPHRKGVYLAEPISASAERPTIRGAPAVRWVNAGAQVTEGAAGTQSSPGPVGTNTPNIEACQGLPGQAADRHEHIEL